MSRYSTNYSDYLGAKRCCNRNIRNCNCGGGNGAQGFQGATGAGFQGATRVQGATGFQGAVGLKDATGFQGSRIDRFQRRYRLVEQVQIDRV
jgi:hypothetical protein